MDGTVVGVVDVMDVIYGCGGADGWRSIFQSSLGHDDGSDASSMPSHESPSRSIKSANSKVSAKKAIRGRSVSNLRPKKPLISSDHESVLAVAQMLANKRGDASIVVGSNGRLSGIITDTDITRRVVAKQLELESTNVSAVMTSDPMCVTLSDSAIDALTCMVENHFRHLPVVDDTGAVVGLLDISKCLHDAITRLERAQEKTNNVAADAVQQALSMQGANAAALQALLGPLMVQAFGTQSSPTLRGVLGGRPSTLVRPDANLLEVGTLMAERRKAALVVEDGRLIGIFGFKDMMTRVVAKQLPLEDTKVSTVMTPNPESVSPNMTVLEALQTMHDNKFLTLPVCEEDGTVIGIVDVMDVIHGCGGAEGWRSIFQSAMELDDQSQSASVSSPGSAKRSTTAASTLKSQTKESFKEREVSKLRPKQALLSSNEESVLEVVQMLSSKRGDAALIVDADGGLSGIITDTDVTRRVVAKQLDPGSTKVSTVMTADPTCVTLTDSALDALTAMVENHFRHLPVVDEEGTVVGLLDIAKCLHDAISRLERAQDKSSGSVAEAVQIAASLQGASGAHAAALHALLSPLMAQAFGNQTIPTLRGLLAGKPRTVVSPDTTLLEVGMLMAENRKAALVVEEGRLVGIFGFKDMMMRAVAKELSLAETAVSSIMTPNPESVSPNITVLEALQTMHDNKFLTLPVCEEDGTVVGLVDVMDVIYGCGGAEGWRSIFNSAMDLDDESVTLSTSKSRITASIPARKTEPVEPRALFVDPLVPGNIPTTLEFQGDENDVYDAKDVSRGTQDCSVSGLSEGPIAIFKVTDPNGNTHRIRTDVKLSILKDALASKSEIPKNGFQLMFVDDEGDSVVISTDDDLADAVNISKASGAEIVKLSMALVKPKSNAIDPILIGAVVVGAVVGILVLVVLRPRRH
jgi:signal-transduction protein with cAMP-binding, CBS, and nucleotidyltransferase domain